MRKQVSFALALSMVMTSGMATVANAAADDGKTNVVFWNSWTGGDGDTLEALVNKFNEESDTVHVEMTRTVLEDVTIPMHPVIADIKKVMQDCGAIGAMMSGSGPTVFGLFENRASAREAQRMIRDKGLTRQAYVTNIHNVRRK